MHSVRNQLQMSHLWRENSNVFQIMKLAWIVIKWDFLSYFQTLCWMLLFCSTMHQKPKDARVSNKKSRVPSSILQKWKSIQNVPYFLYRWKEHEVTNIVHPILEPKDVLRLPLSDALGPIGLLIKCAAIWYSIGQHRIGFRFCSCDTR